MIATGKLPAGHFFIKFLSVVTKIFNYLIWGQVFNFLIYFISDLAHEPDGIKFFLSILHSLQDL